ncbi:protein phosphatase 2C domain-containing protein [Pleurocapsales cyanobacterium LEGE 10410]|nr:protein phosphatase 2C domain-containing protein [Pleurocapsales cyanobacterium LEGE 10410]
MSHSEPKIQCSNPRCAAYNELKTGCCSLCSTPMVRRYLWSSKAISSEQEHGLVDHRYLALGDRIFLDTKPYEPPVTPEEVPQEIVVYLQLFPCYPHIPQVYGLLDGKDTWLFDYGTVPNSTIGKLDYPQQLIPKIEHLWASATALQQINWLWQIAKLWKPMSSKSVASALLEPDLIRINGQIVQLLELKPDREHSPSLKDLGNLWSHWVEDAHPSIKNVLKQLAANLKTGRIDHANKAIAILEVVASHCRQAKQYSYQVYALSDSGPSRANNEDAAYPMHPDHALAPENALAIVCDGVGGHDGGEIASHRTIEYLHNKISKLALGKQRYSSENILARLYKYINESNDLISQQNDSEQRKERQRMGTTLVMTLAQAHEMYLAHVGDSRIYWITPHSCHQVTIDDDLASREVRLGYAVYRDSLQYPSAGALIQAIGMRNSAALHPNLQRYLIDDDCIFLLCTDGLSDLDRVEQQWRAKILPVLEGKQDLASAAQELIALANKQNGHDNVTVALVHCRVKSKPKVPKVAIAWSDVEYILKEPISWSDTNLANSIPPDFAPVEPLQTDTDILQPSIPNQPIGEPIPAKSKPKWLKLLILLLVVSTIVGLIFYYFLQENIESDDERSPAQEKID